jgi:hypothetical protein
MDILLRLIGRRPDWLIPSKARRNVTATRVHVYESGVKSCVADVNARGVAQFHFARRQFHAMVKTAHLQNGVRQFAAKSSQYLGSVPVRTIRTKLRARHISRDAKQLRYRATFNAGPSVRFCGRKMPWPKTHIWLADEGSCEPRR